MGRDVKRKLSQKDAEKYNEKRHKDKGRPLADKIYNNIVDRYSKNGNKFEGSDAFIWSGAVYELPTIFGYLLFITFFLFLAHLSFKRYGDARTIVFVILLVLWRLQVLIGIMSKLNSKF